MHKTIMMFIVGIVGGAIGSQFIALKSSSMPAGALVAFPDDCPQGWQEYNQASGRMLVVDGQGEGLTPRKAGETGGVDEVGRRVETVFVSGGVINLDGEGVIIPDGYQNNSSSSLVKIPEVEMPPYLVVKLCSHSKTH